VRCEVCGRKIHGKTYKVIIEGAKLTVCGRCAKHGTIMREEKKLKPGMPRTKAPIRRSPLRIKSGKSPQASVESNLELAEKFNVRIRLAREKLGLSHEDLGKKIGEKVSVLKKIETGKMTPNNKLSTKLEHALKIKLLIQASDEKTQKEKIPKIVSRKLTLGDLVPSDKKKAEEKTERKR